MRTLYISLFCCFTLWAQSSRTTAFQHARILDGTGRTLENATLVIAGERIVGINVPPPRGAALVDATGKTIVPGLINAHGHLGVTEGAQVGPASYTATNIAEQLALYARFGVTSVLALGLNRDLIYDLRRDQRNGSPELRGAAIYTAGRGIGVPAGAPPLNVGADQVDRPSTAEEARSMVRAAAAHHPDILKIWVDDVGGTKPKMQPEIYRAVIDEAHRNHLRVAAHVFYLDDAKALVSLGVDVIAHSVRDRDVDTDLTSAMKSKGVFYTPTLGLDVAFFVYADHPEWLEDPFLAGALNPDVRKMLADPAWREKTRSDPKQPVNRKNFETALRNLRAMHAAGVNIALGTDSGASPVRIQGFAEHLELELMVHAGLPPLDALASAARGGAAVCGAADRGTLEPGKTADFLVLDANPLDDIRNTRKIFAVWHLGRRVER